MQFRFLRSKRHYRVEHSFSAVRLLQENYQLVLNTKRKHEILKQCATDCRL